MHESSPGQRLSAQGPWLELLFRHLAGAKIRARVEQEDLVQEVYLRALADRSGLPAEEPGEAGLRRYLGRLARNCVMDLLRAMRAAKRDGREIAIARSDWSVSGQAGSQLVAPLPGPSTLAAERERQFNLQRRYEQLSPEHRRVIGFRQFEGLSAAESARRMGRSESAIHSLYRRALLAWGSSG